MFNKCLNELERSNFITYVNIVISKYEKSSKIFLLNLTYYIEDVYQKPITNVLFVVWILLLWRVVP